MRPSARRSYRSGSDPFFNQLEIKSRFIGHHPGMKLSSSWLLACALVLGWGDGGGVGGSNDGGQAPGGGSEGGGAAGGGGGSDGGSSPVDPTPILERDPAITHDCTEERPMTSDIGATNARLEGLVAVDGEFFMTTFEASLDVAKVDLDGSVGDPLSIPADLYVAHASLTVPDGADVVTVWSEGSELHFARIGAGLQFLEGPSSIPETAAENVSPAALVRTASGFVLLYGSGTTSTDLHFLELSADGQASGDPMLVSTLGEQYSASASMTPTDDGGFALAFVGGGVTEAEVMFTVLDADGTPRFTPRRISRPSGGGLSSSFSYNPRRNVVKVGDAYWVAFTESEIDDVAQVGSRIVRIAVVDGDGSATLHALQAPVDQVENLTPQFVELDDALGVVWNAGSITWVCAGCISDYDVHLVLLDREALVPASQVVTHHHQSNGITSPIVAVSGDDLLTGGSLDFHALTIPATGAMRCVPSP